MNLRTSYTGNKALNKVIHPSLEIQGRDHKKAKNMGSDVTTKRTNVLQFKKKKNHGNWLIKQSSENEIKPNMELMNSQQPNEMSHL